MNKMKKWMIGLTIASLLAVGVVALAGNGFGAGSSETTAQATCNGDGAGLGIGRQMGDRPLDGTGCGQEQGYGQNLSENRPLDGTGYGMRQAGVQGQRGCNEDCAGSCL